MGKRRTDYTRCATSFGPAEVEIGAEVLLRLLSGTDVQTLVRRKDFRALAENFERMRTKIRAKTAELAAIEAQQGKLPRGM